MIFWSNLDPFAGSFGCVIWYFNRILKICTVFTQKKYILRFYFSKPTVICILVGINNIHQVLLARFWKNNCCYRNKQYFIWKPQYSASWSRKDKGVAFWWRYRTYHKYSTSGGKVGVVPPWWCHIFLCLLKYQMTHTKEPKKWV